MRAPTIVPPGAEPPRGPFDGVEAPVLRSVEEAITTTLREAIRRGDLRPGSRLPQEKLAEQLNVSRIPLRDALRRLEVERLVRIDPHRGAEVVSLGPEDVTEIYDVLLMLEEVAMRRAVRALDDRGAARLIEMSDRMDTLLDDPVAGSEALRAFYAELYLHAMRSRMTMTIMRLRDSVQRYHVLKRTLALHDHAALRGAIVARDAESAVKTHLAHLRRVRDDLVGVLEDERREDRWKDGGKRDQGRAALPILPGPPIAQQSGVEETITSALRDRILQGDLPPGSRLIQDQLAASFGVSRIPLRDALRWLEVEDLVRIDPRRGAYVAELTVADVQETYELRELLEPLCMRYAVRALDDAAIAETVAMSTAMESPAPTAAVGLARRRAFYAALYARAGKPRMLELILRLRDDVHRYHVLTRVSESVHAHSELRECIRRRDAEAAAKVSASHLRNAGNDLIEVLSRQHAKRSQ